VLVWAIPGREKADRISIKSSIEYEYPLLMKKRGAELEVVVVVVVVLLVLLVVFVRRWGGVPYVISQGPQNSAPAQRVHARRSNQTHNQAGA
jgi:hypothetical protein